MFYIEFCLAIGSSGVRFLIPTGIYGVASKETEIPLRELCRDWTDSDNCWARYTRTAVIPMSEE